MEYTANYNFNKPSDEDFYDIDVFNENVDAIDRELHTETTARTAADNALQSAIDTHKNDKTNPHGVTKAQLEIENVDNTSDLDKPISTATQAALDAESSARAEADEKLRNGLNTESEIREQADGVLRNKLNTEIKERKEADRAIWESIDAKFGEAFSGGGSGTEADPYMILSREDLEKVRNDLTAHYKLAGSIYLNTLWEPIGNQDTPFTGVFDGDGYTIRNMTITAGVGSDKYAALFSANSGTIRNIRFEDVHIKNNNYSVSFAAIVAVDNKAGGVISGCAVVSGSLESYNRAGGIVCSNAGTIENSYNKANVTSGWSAGIAERNIENGSIINTYNVGRIDTELNATVSGVVYWNMENATITNSYTLAPKAVVNTTINSAAEIGCASIFKSAMQTKETFVNWDFIDVWKIDEGQYPTFRISKAADPIINDDEPDGSAERPFVIYNQKELQDINNCPNAHYVLANDIWPPNEFTHKPIGSEDKPFTGVFDGAGHEIGNIKISEGVKGESGTAAGLFAVNAGEIRDLGVSPSTTGVSVSASDAYVGIIAGINQSAGKLIRVYAENGTVSSGGYAGGLVGYNKGEITDAYNQSAIREVSGSTGVKVGGIAAVNTGMIKQCYSTGAMTGISSVAFRGSIAYSNSGTIDVVIGIYDLIADGTPVIRGSKVRSSALYRQKATYTDVGWEFYPDFPDSAWNEPNGTYYATLRTPGEIENKQITAMAAAITEQGNMIDMLTAAILEG